MKFNDEILDTIAFILQSFMRSHPTPNSSVQNNITDANSNMKTHAIVSSGASGTSSYHTLANNLDHPRDQGLHEASTNIYNMNKNTALHLTPPLS